VIDVATDGVIDANPDTPQIDCILLQLQNPTGDVWYDRILHRVLVVSSGEFLVLDGGIEAVNPFTFETEVLITEQALGADLNAARIVSPTLGYAIVNDASFNTCLVSFDPSTGQLLDSVLCTDGFQLSDLEVSLDGKLYVCDRTPVNPGIRVYDAATGALLNGPVNVGLPPYDLVILDGSPHGPVAHAPVALSARQTLHARPNPFNPRVVIELRGPLAEEAVDLRICDARGRVVTTLASPRREEDRWVYEWNGHDERGRPVASGTYRAAAVDGSTSPIPLSLVR
jgi:hypothetical protein